MDSFIIRETTAQDVPLILSFIRELADYEHLTVSADEESLRRWLFEEKKAVALIGEFNGQAAGYAIYFYNFSSFLGQAGIYLEDIYVKPELRGKGFGKSFLKRIARIAVEKGCGRMEWTCLDWNLTGIDFYTALGAQQMNEWLLFRLTGDQLVKVAKESS